MQNSYEVTIIGGGPAGLSAALTLGRSGRRTLVFDAGRPRNAPARAAHNFFTRDGTPPHELLEIGREQLGAYPSVELRQVPVQDVEKLPRGGFALLTQDGNRTTTEQLVLATGVVDTLPRIGGLRELWGIGVFHCPYCHGWEVRGQPFVLIAQQTAAMHLALLLRGWSPDVTVCPVSSEVFSPQELRSMSSAGLKIKAPVVELRGDGSGAVREVVLEDGEQLGPAAVFTSAPLRQRSPLPEQLGCQLHEEGVFKGLVKVDEFGASGVPGLYVVGDAAQGFAQVSIAASEGSKTAAMLNNELLLQGRMPRGKGFEADV